MTKFDLNGIITIIYNEINHSVKLNMEGYLKQYHQTSVSEDKSSCPTKSKLMILEKKSVNLTHASNFLIQLFYKTGKKYSCTRIKIGKLLSIVAFSYAREGIQLFDESICKYGDCGTTINELTSFLARDVYRCGSYEDSIEQIDMNSLIEASDEIEKDGFQDIHTLPDDVKNRIGNIFSVFGAYSPRQLGEALYSFISCGDMIMDDGTIDLSKIYELTETDYKVLLNVSDSSSKVVFFLLSNNF